jgi:hypothetical protein
MYGWRSVDPKLRGRTAQREWMKMEIPWCAVLNVLSSLATAELASVVVLSLLEQKTTCVAATVRVGAHDVALGVDPTCSRPDPKGRRYIDGGKLALAQQKTMKVAAAVFVESHDVTFRVDPARVRTPRQRSRFCTCAAVTLPFGAVFSATR